MAHQPRRLGPDATRYWLAAGGAPVPRPFYLRWLLPKVCGQHVRRWWFVYGASWVVAGAAMFAWASNDGWQTAAAATVLLLALPGILGPGVSIPVQVDMPATALTLAGCAVWDWSPMAALALFAVAATFRETAPMWAALWLWTPWALLAMSPVIVAALVRKPGPDPLGERFQAIADHPIRAALEHHVGRWRDGWLMVAPWGVCLAALYAPDWRYVVVLAVAYAQLLVATDTVRLVQHAAGPPMALAAASTIPPAWLPLAVALHVCWFWKPERV